MKFLRDCLGGAKKLLTLSEAIPVVIPKLPEFNAEALFRQAADDETVSRYLPDPFRGPKQRSCSRRFLFTVSANEA
jgi:hypothetical protein